MTTKEIVLKEEQLTSDQKQLLRALKLWRKDLATERNVPDFIIIHFNVLLLIAAARPTTTAQLSEIAGMGDHRIKFLGDDIIAIVNAFN